MAESLAEASAAAALAQDIVAPAATQGEAVAEATEGQSVAPEEEPLPKLQKAEDTNQAETLFFVLALASTGFHNSQCRRSMPSAILARQEQATVAAGQAQCNS